MQAAKQTGASFALNDVVKVGAIQQLFEADKAAALATQQEIRAKKEADCNITLKVRLDC